MDQNSVRSGNYIHGAGAGKAKMERMDLGLALMSAAALPGTHYTQQDIAAWCECTYQRVQQIERRALRKVRRRMEHLGLSLSERI